MTDGLDDDTVLGGEIGDAPPRGTPCVVVLTGSAAGAFLHVPPGAATIGRAPTAQLRFEEAGVSRNHAQIRTDGTGRAWIEDLGSSNGTFLNTQRIQTEQQLRDGDTIQIGFTTVLRFVFEELPEVLMDDSQASRDPGTALYSRDYLFTRLAAELTLASRRQLALSVLVLEPNDLASFADRYGAGVCDAALAALASAILATKRADEVVARYGETRLVIVLRACAMDAANGVARRLRQSLAELVFLFGGAQLRATVSIGVAGVWAQPAQTPQELLAAADLALASSRSEP